MLIEVKVPQLSESVSEATLMAWNKKEGEAVSRDENLIDIETDKVVLETPAPADGVLVKIVKQDGDTVTSGELIAQIDTEAKETAAPVAEKTVETPAAPAAAAPVQDSVSTASPAARKILEEKGVSGDDLAGTGRGGRVTKQDAQAASTPAPTPKTEAPAPARDSKRDTANRAEERVPMTRSDDLQRGQLGASHRDAQKIW